MPFLRLFIFFFSFTLLWIISEQNTKKKKKLYIFMHFIGDAIVFPHPICCACVEKSHYKWFFIFFFFLFFVRCCCFRFVRSHFFSVGFVLRSFLSVLGLSYRWTFVRSGNNAAYALQTYWNSTKKQTCSGRNPVETKWNGKGQKKILMHTTLIHQRSIFYARFRVVFVHSIRIFFPSVVLFCAQERMSVHCARLPLVKILKK